MITFVSIWLATAISAPPNLPKLDVEPIAIETIGTKADCRLFIQMRKFIQGTTDVRGATLGFDYYTYSLKGKKSERLTLPREITFSSPWQEMSEIDNRIHLIDTLNHQVFALQGNEFCRLKDADEAAMLQKIQAAAKSPKDALVDSLKHFKKENNVSHPFTKKNTFFFGWTFAEKYNSAANTSEVFNWNNEPWALYRVGISGECEIRLANKQRPKEYDERVLTFMTPVQR